MKGHSNDKWNERADKEADKGCQGGTNTGEEVKRKARREREEAPLHDQEQRDIGVRWVTYRPSVTRAVHMSSTRAGCLNVLLPKRGLLERSAIQRAAAKTLKGLAAERGREDIGDRAIWQAQQKVKDAARDLCKKNVQRMEQARMRAMIAQCIKT